MSRGQEHSYDRNGRHSSMLWTIGTSQYQYTNFGALESVSVDGGLYRLVYDPLSRIDSLVVVATGSGNTTVREKRTYDLDGRMVRRERGTAHAPIGQLYLDSLFYDQRGKVTRARMYSAAQQTQGVRYTYDPQGAVVAQEFTRDLGGYQVEEFRNDAYGNVFYQRTRSSAGVNDAPFASTYGPDGLLMGRDAVLPSVPTQNQRIDDLEQTSQGSDVSITSRLVRQPPINGGAWIEQLAGRNYFSADNRLMVVQRYDAFLGSSTDLGTWEEYRYDAFGRRILTRTRRDLNARPDSSHFLCLDPAGGSCGSYIERTEWDGDRILVEWRTAEGTPTGMTQGISGYVHLEGLDHPVGVIRTDGRRVINYTWRGLGESSVYVATGSSSDCAIFWTGCPAVNWPGTTQGGVYFTPNLLSTGPSGPFNWFGTLVDNGGGTSGLLYRRNRYFDVVTGRFTQQDPIGVAGGMNLYGFADGDPVNFSDPFGLCPPKDNNVNDCPAESSRSFWDRLWNGPLYVEIAGQRLAITAGTVPDVTPGGGVARTAFRSFRGFKRAMGAADEGMQWHHIVEQAGNAERFGAEAVNSVSNLVQVPHAIHQQISAYYSSKRAFTGGQTVRMWLRNQSFDDQMKFGLDLLRSFGLVP